MQEMRRKGESEAREMMEMREELRRRKEALGEAEREHRKLM